MENILNNDTIVLGLLMGILGFVFYTSSLKTKGWKTFYTIFPPLLVCYFAPALLNWPLGLVDPSESQLYYVASRYLLPACLILLCLSIDLASVRKLGSKAIIMFLTATLGIVIGGPIALMTVLTLFPDLIPASPDQIWRGLSTVAGSWIGGGANQVAMKEIYEVSDDLFATMLIVDLLVGNVWLGILIFGAERTQKIDQWLQADVSAIELLKEKVSKFRASIERIPASRDLFILGAVAFGGVAISHFCAELIVPFFEQFSAAIRSMRLDSVLSPFFWLVVVATTLGLIFSFTRFKKLEGVGASRWGTVFIYILVTTIGMKMNLKDVFENLGLVAIGATWMIIHVTLLVVVAKVIKAPFFFVAVGSSANVGGAASAPVVAAAFDSALAPVGVLLAVLGYAIGTYGAIVCATLMGIIAT